MITGRDAWRILLLWMGLSIVILFILVMIVVIIEIMIELATGQSIDIPKSLRFDWGEALTSVLIAIAFLAPIFLLGRWRGWHWREVFRWRPLPWSITLKVTIASLALDMAVAGGLLWLEQNYDLPEEEESDFEQWEDFIRTHGFSPLLLLDMILPAFCEELTFRGVIQQGFERRYGPAIAIGLVSLIFALLHADLVQSLAVLPTSLFWGWVVYRTQSVIPTVIAHACWNALVTLSLVADALWGNGNGASLTPFWMIAIVVIVGLLIWGGLTWHLARSLPRPERGVEEGGDEAFTDDRTGATEG